MDYNCHPISRMKIKALVGTIILTTSTSGLPQGVLDQSFLPVEPNVYYDNFSGNSIGQTFTVGLTGTLTEVDVWIARNEPLPDGDVVVMHKLMIEANEQEYLQKANHFAPGIISLRCQHL